MQDKTNKKAGLKNVTDDQAKSVPSYIIKIKEALQISKLGLPRYGVVLRCFQRLLREIVKTILSFFKLCRSFAVSVIYRTQTFDLFKKHFNINFPFPISNTFTRLVSSPISSFDILFPFHLAKHNNTSRLGIILIINDSHH